MLHVIFYTVLFLPNVFAIEEYPWTYDNDMIGGPNFWGLMLGKQCEICSKGKLQSPIDIRPNRLLFDPNALPMVIDRTHVMAEMVNTGQMARVRIGNSAIRPTANLTGGPLHGYRYRIQRMDLHFGRDSVNGSEHTIDGRKYPMEIQMLAFNSDLYTNFSQASKSPHGLAAIAVLVDFGPSTTDELLKLTIATASVIYKAQRVELSDLKPWKLLPQTRDYVTYDGSISSPPCHETVTWMIVNQPIHISQDHFREWGKLLQTKEKPKSGEEPKFIAPNTRHTQEFQQRLLRTNIQLKMKTRKECKLPMPAFQYKSSNRIDPHIRYSNTTRHRRRHLHHSYQKEWDL
ncbi:unnamed protein product [Auanema sp. JU1783]|nr:unnamed protein product [Auanema sp. JU1783]